GRRSGTTPSGSWSPARTAIPRSWWTRSSCSSSPTGFHAPPPADGRSAAVLELAPHPPPGRCTPHPSRPGPSSNAAGACRDGLATRRRSAPAGLPVQRARVAVAELQAETARHVPSPPAHVRTTIDDARGHDPAVGRVLERDLAAAWQRPVRHTHKVAG